MSDLVTESPSHEKRDVSFRPIVWAAAGLVVVLLLVVVAMWALFGLYAARESAASPPRNPLAAEVGRGQPPQPRLQAAPIEDLRLLRDAENRILSQYSWASREEKRVRLPIERAMQLLVERGSAAKLGASEGGP